MKIYCKRTTFAWVAVLLCLAATEAYAAFEFEAQPRRGGRSIHFDASREGDLLKNEEVTLTVSTDEAVQYKISQTVFQPLTNEFGQTIPQDAFIVFSPSTPIGMLRTKMESPVPMGQFPIYTSNSTGEADEFTLVYNIRLPEGQPGGMYRSQITYTAEPVIAAAGLNPRIITLDVRVEVDAQFRIEIQNSKGMRSLDLGRITKDRLTGSEVLNVELQSSPGARFRITGEMSSSLTSQTGETLREEAFVVMQTVSASSGLLQVSPTAVAVGSAPMPIYVSENGGTDRFQIQFVAQPDMIQKAGIYSGTFTFRLESQSPFVTSQVISIPVQVEIESIFSLETKIDQGFSLNFGSFRTGKEREERKVILTVRSNLGQPYQVMQMVPRKMMNEDGTVLAADNFQYQASASQTGVSAVPSAMPVEAGERLVFTSDKNGAPENIVLTYSLTIPPGSKAGNYTSEIKYSMTTL